ncbi:MAG: hypothetical protein JO014_23555, partial [Metakosakonia sp.]
KIKQIAHRRIYDTIGCSITFPEDPNNPINYQFDIKIKINGIDVDIAFTTKPRMSFTTIEMPQIIYVGEAEQGTQTIRDDFKGTIYEGHLITEIAAYKNVNDSPIDEQTTKEELKYTVDIAAAMVGVSLSPQFVYQMILEEVNYWTTDNKRKWETSPLQVTAIDRIEYEPNDLLKKLKQTLPIQFHSNYAKTHAAKWLIRAWSEKDPIMQFLALFIPIEIILKGEKPDINVEEQEAHKKTLGRIKELISRQKDPDLTQCFKKLLQEQKAPPLILRFQARAKRVNPTNWKTDVDAFTAFNKIRNNLIHQGDPAIAVTTRVTPEQVISLMDIANHYVSNELFELPTDTRKPLVSVGNFPA